MKRYVPCWILIGLFMFLWFPDAAFADNCGSFRDCFNTQRAAVSATVGLAIFATLLSIGLNFVPVVGQVKGVIEAITGKDMITGDELETWERAMNLVPFGAIGRVGRIGNILDAGGDLGRGVRHTDDFGGLSGAGRAGRSDPPSGSVRGDIGGSETGRPSGGARPDDGVGGSGSGPRRPPDETPERPPGSDPAGSGAGGGSKPPRDHGSGHGNRGDDGDGPRKPGDEGGSGKRDGDGSGDSGKSNNGKNNDAGAESAKSEKERLKQEMMESPSSSKWGTLDDGSNQGIKHFAYYWEKYPERVPSLAKRLGVDPADFQNSARGFENFTAQAERVTTSKIARLDVNGKDIYYLEGAANAKKGVVVIVKDGKIQTMMPSDPKSFQKLQ